MVNPDPKKETDPKQSYFHVRYLFWLVLLLLFLLAILSHNREDLAILEGGGSPDAAIRNWIGPLGANIARILFYLFGVAVYFICAILTLSVIRSFLPAPLHRRGYVGAVCSLALGLTILLAMYPQLFLQTTDRLGIGRAEKPALALSGGTIGAKLAAPADLPKINAGLIRRHIGEIGTLVVALALILPAAILLLLDDWILLFFGPARKPSELTGDSKDANKRVATDSPGPPPSPAEPALPNASPEISREPGFFARVFLRRKKEAVNPHDDEEIKPPPPPCRIRRVTNTIVPDEPTSNGTPPRDDHEQEEILPPDTRTNGRIQPSSSNGAPPRAGAEAVVVASLPRPESRASVESDASESDIPESATPPGVTLYSQEKRKYDKMQPERDPLAPKENGRHSISCPEYTLPPVSMLEKHDEVSTEDTSHIEQSRDRLQQTLESFNVDAHVSEIVVGPRVTRFEVSLDKGVKVEKVTSIQNNIAMDLEARSLRILAPIPGKNAVGIEVPNKVSSIVYIRSLMESPSWKESSATIPIILGRDIAGKVMVTDLAKAPHLLIAGSTGSGKSVCMNTLVMSLLFKYSPADLRLIMVDPKVVELEMYRPLPHLITPVVNDPKKVPLALRWGVNEMERRYRILAKVKAKNLAGFNSRPQDKPLMYDEEGQLIPQKLPLLVIIVDELADIMMTDAKSDVETSICRIAQKGRAAGIHLVIATQTPRKDVVTGLIKANLPTKIAFKVGSNMDSRVILDQGGAEKLLGYGDMLFNPPGASGLERIQGSMVADAEIQKVVDFVSGQVEQNFDSGVLAEDAEVSGIGVDSGDSDDDMDVSAAGYSPGVINSIAAKYLEPDDPPLMRKALEIIITEQKASTSYLQRRLGIGYNKSAELMDELEERGIISAPLPGGQKREILVTDGLETNE